MARFPRNTVNPGTPLAMPYRWTVTSTADRARHDLPQLFDEAGIYHYEDGADSFAVEIDSREDDIALARLSAENKLWLVGDTERIR